MYIYLQFKLCKVRIQYNNPNKEVMRKVLARSSVKGLKKMLVRIKGDDMREEVANSEKGESQTTDLPTGGTRPHRDKFQVCPTFFDQVESHEC